MRLFRMKRISIGRFKAPYEHNHNERYFRAYSRMNSGDNGGKNSRFKYTF